MRGYGDLKMLVINISLSILKFVIHGPRIIHTQFSKNLRPSTKTGSLTQNPTIGEQISIAG